MAAAVGCPVAELQEINRGFEFMTAEAVKAPTGVASRRYATQARVPQNIGDGHLFSLRIAER